MCRFDVFGWWTAIREGIRSELYKVEHHLDFWNVEKSQRHNIVTLFCWNSWARAGHSLRTARFGCAEEALLNIEWLSAYELLREGPSTYDALVLVSLSPKSGLTVFVAISSSSALAEMGKVSAAWEAAI